MSATRRGRGHAAARRPEPYGSSSQDPPTDRGEDESEDNIPIQEWLKIRHQVNDFAKQVPNFYTSYTQAGSDATTGQQSVIAGFITETGPGSFF